MKQDMEFKASFLTGYKKDGGGKRRKFRKSVYPSDPSNNIMSAMWEVRIKDSLQNEIVRNSNRDEDAVMMRNVMTGLYLHFDEERGITLKSKSQNNSNTKGFFFYFKMKNNWTSDNSIK